jgi:serine/threonine protein kinase
MSQLVRAVGFIHEKTVAHLDIKPSNAIIFEKGGSAPSLLQLIDFSVSVRGRSEVEGFIGTPGWVAPEVGLHDGLPRLFNPIRADLWACGNLIRVTLSRYSADDYELFKLADALLNDDPRKRPGLSQQYTVVVQHEAPDLWDGPHKRARLDALQDGKFVKSFGGGRALIPRESPFLPTAIC